MAVLGAVGRRVAIFVVTVVVASLVIFLIVEALPGDVAVATLGTGATPESVAALRAQWGLDRPLFLRYLEWLGGLVRGDFGRSYATGLSVTAQVARPLGVTAWLVVWAVPLSTMVALPVGLVAAMKRRRVVGVVVNGLGSLGLAVPVFFTGTLLVILFAVVAHWLPANGYIPLAKGVGPWLAHLVLPVTAIVVVQASLLARYVRAGFIDVLTEDYYRTARAVGWTAWRGLVRHGLRNVATSLVTVVGLQTASLLVGAVLVEQVFVLPGIGSLLVAAVKNRDLVVVQGVVMLLVFVVLAINFLVDLAYMAIDPRVVRRAR